MKAEDMPEYRHTAERLAELEKKVAELERSLAEHRDWHVGLEQRILEQRAGIIRRKKLSATREDATS